MHIRYGELAALVLAALVVIVSSIVVRGVRRRNRARRELDRLHRQHPHNEPRFAVGSITETQLAQIAAGGITADKIAGGTVTLAALKSLGGVFLTMGHTARTMGDEWRHLYALVFAAVLTLGASACTSGGIYTAEPTVRTIAPRGCHDCTATRPPFASRARL